nr:hypothetical protein [Micromonospora sp. DSM 115978]
MAHSADRSVLVFASRWDRWLVFTLGSVFVAWAVWQTAQPVEPYWPDEIALMIMTALIGWFCWRYGIRMRLVAGESGFDVVNLLTIHHVPYRLVQAIGFSGSTITLQLTTGEKVRVWALSESLLETSAGRGHRLARRLGALAEQRREGAPAGRGHVRRYVTDWWVIALLAAVLGVAITARPVFA